jgi:hypothetical protein
MRVRHIFVLLLTACVSQPRPADPPPATPIASSPTPTAPPALCHAPHGSTITVTAAGIVLSATSGMADRGVLTPERGRHLRLHDTLDILYYFDSTRPILRAIDNTFGAPRTVLELPPIEHPGFPSTDPLAFLQRQQDLSVSGGILCIDLHDRPENPTLSYNVRVDLATGAHERRLVEDLTGDSCGVDREAVRPRLCTPNGPPGDGLCIELPLVAAVPMAPTAARAGTP